MKKTLKDKKEESIKRIIEAAKEVFADAGFAGARVDEIARRAGVNKAMIYYRVGDKEALYSEVLHQVFGDTAERISRNIKDDQPPEEKLKVYIHGLLQTAELHPHMPRLMMREFASGGRNVPEVVALDLARMLDILLKILEHGVEEGVFIDTNPFLPHMMAVGAMAFYKLSDPLRAKYLGLHKDLRDKVNKFPRNASQEIEELILRAVKKSS